MIFSTSSEEEDMKQNNNNIIIIKVWSKLWGIFHVLSDPLKLFIILSVIVSLSNLPRFEILRLENCKLFSQNIIRICLQFNSFYSYSSKKFQTPLEIC